ncbi:MAG: arylsulfatase A-like enzyme [Planctomycetota bacterium]|jgi:arylsulfatase A-like enzyme
MSHFSLHHPRNAALLALALGAAASCGNSEPAGDPKPLNVLLITLDTTRADRLGCYGYEAADTPVIDKLAADGLRFERALSTAGITPMSHSSILTGLNNYDHGMRVFHSEEVSHRLKDEVDTLPEILGRQGWRTGAALSAYPVSEHYNLNQGIESFSTGSVKVQDLALDKQQKHTTHWARGGASLTQRCGNETIDDALSFMQAGDPEQPWCLWVHLFDVHDFSIVPPAEFLEELGIECPPEGTLTQGRAQHKWRETMYNPELTFMDRQLGRLVEQLEASGEMDSTIIVLTADHGQGLLDGLERHGWGKHRLLYDWSLHVPMIVVVPGMESAVVNAQVRTIDVLPTVLEALNMPAAKGIQGRSMIGLARGEKESEPRMAYADALNIYDTHAPKPTALKKNYDNLYCATDGRWKLIWHQVDEENSELFHLTEDPLELKNLWSKDHPEAQRLFAFLEANEAWKTEKPTAHAAADSNALEGLGYGGDGEDESEDEPQDGDDD